MKNSVTENYLQNIQEEKVDEAIGLVTASIAASLALTAYNFYKDNVAKAARYCADFKSQEKTKCLLGYKIKATKQMIGSLKSGMSKCKDDDSCKRSVMKKIKNATDKLNTLQQKMNMVMQQKY